MKPSLLVLHVAAALAAPGADERDVSIVRKGSALLLNGKPWKAVGPNIYWLGLDENVIPPKGEPFYAKTNASYPTKGRITEAMGIVKAMGGTMIRAHTLGVSTGNPLSIMPSPGVVNERAFEPIDWAVHQAREKGLRLMVPLTDNYDYYHGGKFNFLRWGGLNLTQSHDSSDPRVQEFYNNATIVKMFKDYIHTLLTHVNPHNNLTYANDPTIFAYETGNELLGSSWGDMNVPAAWISDIGRYVKSLAPNKLFVDGTYGINEEHLNITEVDIFSDHFYPPIMFKLKDDLRLVASVNKTYFVGEYDWVGDQGRDDMPAFFKELETNPVAGGDTFWSQFGHNVPDCTTFVNHTESFTLQYGNPANSAKINKRIQLIRKHFVKMSRGEDISATAALPAVACPFPD